MRDSAKTGAQLVASYVLSLAMFALASALVYFAYQLSLVSTQIPDILDSVDDTSANVEPIVNEVGEIRQLIPDILHEIEQTRQLVPPMLREIEQTRQQIPPILKQVEAVRGDIPAVLQSTDKASDAVVTAAREIEATRPLVPEVLKQVEITREAIPPMLDRADAMIDKARTAGTEASSGAVTGFFKGLITTPFVIVGDVGKSLTGMSDEEAEDYTDRDFEIIEAAALDLLNHGKRGDIRVVSNPDSGMSTNFKLVAETIEEEDFVTVECRTLQMESYIDGERTKTANRTFCREEGGGWDLNN